MENKLRKIRKEKGLTQAELARESGVHRTSIARYEAGIHEPGRKSLLKLARTLQVPVDALIEGTESA